MQTVPSPWPATNHNVRREIHAAPENRIERSKGSASICDAPAKRAPNPAQTSSDGTSHLRCSHIWHMYMSGGLGANHGVASRSHSLCQSDTFLCFNTCRSTSHVLHVVYVMRSVSTTYQYGPSSTILLLAIFSWHQPGNAAITRAISGSSINFRTWLPISCLSRLLPHTLQTDHGRLQHNKMCSGLEATILLARATVESRPMTTSQCYLRLPVAQDVSARPAWMSELAKAT